MRYNIQEYTLSLPEKEIKINLKYGYFTIAELLEFIAVDEVHSYCKSGCSQYMKNWSCPPNSQSLNEYSVGFNFLLVVLGYSKLETIGHDKKGFPIAYNLIKEFISKQVRQLELKVGGKAITGACCDLCNNCPANGCIYPEQMRHNFTSLGFRMDHLSKKLFEHELLWSENAEYISCFGGLLTNNPNVKLDLQQ